MDAELAAKDRFRHTVCLFMGQLSFELVFRRETTAITRSTPARAKPTNRKLIPFDPLARVCVVTGIVVVGDVVGGTVVTAGEADVAGGVVVGAGGVVVGGGVVAGEATWASKPNIVK